VAVQAPRHLSDRSRKVYRTLVDDYRLHEEPAALTTLRLACEALDRTEQARIVIDREGLTVATTDGAVKTHPAVAIERDSRLAALRAFRELGLEPAATGDDVRPPRAQLRSVG
jgi:P27 family predicted phage terminase small subunit